jgi:hypothetical protein
VHYVIIQLPLNMSTGGAITPRIKRYSPDTYTRLQKALQQVSNFAVRQNALLTAYSALLSIKGNYEQTLKSLALTPCSPTIDRDDFIKELMDDAIAGGVPLIRGDDAGRKHASLFIQGDSESVQVLVVTISTFPNIRGLPKDVALEDITWVLPSKCGGAYFKFRQLLPNVLLRSFYASRNYTIANELKTYLQDCGKNFPEYIFQTPFSLAVSKITGTVWEEVSAFADLLLSSGTIPWADMSAHSLYGLDFGALEFLHGHALFLRAGRPDISGIDAFLESTNLNPRAQCGLVTLFALPCLIRNSHLSSILDGKVAI